jgi:hypothetical protein
MLKKKLKKFVSLVAVVALGATFIGIAPAQANGYTWTALESGGLGSGSTKLVTIPRDAIAVESTSFLDDERVRTDTTNDSSYEYDDSRVCESFVLFVGNVPDTCDGTDPYTNTYSRAVGSSDTLRYKHDSLANSGVGSYAIRVAYVPQEPTINRVIKSSNGASAQVFFTAPVNNGPAITDYKYNLGLGGGWQSLPVADATSPITIPNLARSVGYNLQLLAVNVNGDGIPSAPAIFSVEPQDDQFTIATATSAVATDAAATASINFTAIAGSTYNAVTLTPVLISGPATNIKWAKDITYLPGTTVNLEANEVDADTGMVTVDPSNTGRFTYPATASFTPTVAGTYVFRFTASGAVNNQSFTWTVTATNPAVAASTAFLSSSTGTAPTADSALASPAASQTAARARLTVRQFATTAASTVTPIVTIADKWASAVTVAISGAGSVALTDSAVARYSSVSILAAAAATQDFWVFSDGRTGTATITVTVGSTVVATKSFVFHGSATTITPTVVNSVIQGTGGLGTSATGAITAVVTDANGNPVSGATVYDVSSATTVISDSYSSCGTTAADGKVTCNLTGLVAGTANITLTTNASSTATTGISSAPVAIRVGAAPATATVTFDKGSYLPGERATITVALRDAAGLAVANADYANIFAATMTSTSVIAAGNLPGTTITTTGSTGNATFSINMPLVSGNVSVTGTGSTGLPTAAQVAIAGSTVVDPSVEVLAATDAATEAIDAANAATDAANAAAEAADAATAAAQDAADAVVALSTQVAEMIDALKKQITALTNLVIKIQKKVKA